MEAQILNEYIQLLDTANVSQTKKLTIRDNLLTLLNREVPDTDLTVLDLDTATNIIDRYVWYNTHAPTNKSRLALERNLREAVNNELDIPVRQVSVWFSRRNNRKDSTFSGLRRIKSRVDEYRELGAQFNENVMNQFADDYGQRHTNTAIRPVNRIINAFEQAMTRDYNEKINVINQSIETAVNEDSETIIPFTGFYTTEFNGDATERDNRLYNRFIADEAVHARVAETILSQTNIDEPVFLKDVSKPQMVQLLQELRRTIGNRLLVYKVFVGNSIEDRDLSSGSFRTIKASNLDTLIQHFRIIGREVKIRAKVSDYDEEWIPYVDDLHTIDIAFLPWKKYNKNGNAEGALFPYRVRKADSFDQSLYSLIPREYLESYMIYDTFDASRYNEICLFRAIHEYTERVLSNEISEKQVNRIKEKLELIKTKGYNTYQNIPASALESISNELGVRIHLATMNSRNEYKYNENSTGLPIVKIALLKLSTDTRHYIYRLPTKKGRGNRSHWSILSDILNNTSLFERYFEKYDVNELSSIAGYWNSNDNTELELRHDMVERNEVGYEVVDDKDNLDTQVGVFPDVVAIDFETRSMFGHQQVVKKRVSRELVRELQDIYYSTAYLGYISYEVTDIKYDTHGNSTEVNNYVSIQVDDSCFTEDEEKGDVALNMLKTLDKVTTPKKYEYNGKTYEHVTLIAHNAKYEFELIRKHVVVVKKLEIENSLIMVQFMFNKKNYLLKDSMKMIDMPLGDFGKSFGLKTRKEILPYKFYDGKKISEMKKVKLSDFQAEIPESDREQLMKNCREWNCFVNSDEGMVDAYKYSAEYCKIDTITLLEGWSKFREQVLEIAPLDINGRIFTVSSLAEKIIIHGGGYEGVVRLTGYTMSFHQKSVYGGRTMCAGNLIRSVNQKATTKHRGKEVTYYEHKVYEKSTTGYKLVNSYNSMKPIRLADCDVNSMYSAGIVELGGALKGAPKKINSETISFVNSQVTGEDKIKALKSKNWDGYYVHVKINEVKKELELPTLCDRNKETGINDYLNEELVESELVLSWVQLEDFVNFNRGNFSLIQGYYYNEGLNTRYAEIVQGLYEKRLELKAKKNPIQIVYKLILNSIFGKSILRYRDTKYLYFNNKDNFKTFVSKNFASVREFEQISKYDKASRTVDQWKVTVNVNKHYEHTNRAQIGSAILGMSKRIMNRVTTLAQDNGIRMYYSDTDSLIIEESKLPLLEELYREKYNAELMGPKLGQFSSDFGDANEYGCRAIFLGKKQYGLEILNQNGQHEKYHLRLKGIPSVAIKTALPKVVEEYKKCHRGVAPEDSKNPLEVYKWLLGNKSVKFDVTGEAQKYTVRYTAQGIRSVQKGQFIRELGKAPPAKRKGAPLSPLIF